MTPIGIPRRSFLAAALGWFAAAGCKRAEPLPELGRVPEFALTSQEGRAFGSRQLAGKVWVASFFFTRCPTVCPRLIAALRSLQERAKARDIPLQFVAFSVDPEHDTPPVLREFAARQKVDLASFAFLTGEAALIEKTAEDGFKLAVDGRADAGAEHFGLLHGSHLVLVDPNLVIRGYYRSEEADQQERLLADAERLAP